MHCAVNSPIYINKRIDSFTTSQLRHCAVLANFTTTPVISAITGELLPKHRRMILTAREIIKFKSSNIQKEKSIYSNLVADNG